MNKYIFILMVLVMIAVTACTSEETSIQKPTETNSPTMAIESDLPPMPIETGFPTAASDSGQTIPFPRENEADSQSAMEALKFGRIVLVDGCIRVTNEESGSSHLLIWPPDFRFIDEDGVIKILDGDGNIAVKVGDMARMGGGEINQFSLLPKYIQDQIPSQCLAPYWIIGEEITTMDATK